MCQHDATHGKLGELIMNEFKITYIAVTRKNNIRKSAFRFGATCAEMARLAVENLLSQDFTLHSYKILSVFLT
jgi:hypothetical protein